MAIRLHNDDLARLVDAGDDDPIVWACTATRGATFKTVLCKLSDRERLIGRFGRERFARHLRQAEADLIAWEQTGTYGVQ